MMTSISKSLGTLFTLLFFIGVIGSAYTLYRFPEDLMTNSRTIDLIQMGQLHPLLNRLYLTMGGTFGVGMVAIAMLFINRNGQFSSDNINVKVAKKRNSEEKSKEEKASSAGITQIHLEGIEEILDSDEDVPTLFNRALSLICKQLEASQAAAYQVVTDKKHRMIELFASYAHHVPDGEKVTYRFGEGLAGQAAKEGKLLNIKSVPEGYIQIISGLGSATPSHLLIVPFRNEGKVAGVVEIASFTAFFPEQEIALQEAFDKLALKLVINDNVSLAKAKS